MLGEIDKPKLSTKEMLKSTLSVFLMKDMILLSITSAYIGIQWCFWLSVFPTCVAFTKTLGNENDKPVMLALCVIFQGIGQVGACIYMSMKLPKLRPKILTTVAIFIQLLMFGLVFLMFPKMSSLDNTYDESIIKPIQRASKKWQESVQNVKKR
uniref:Uncharacterized protein n=1 Tax=Acrobeloides nanus TaxID=290746 RepID=A0A914DTI6_9BILA